MRTAHKATPRVLLQESESYYHWYRATVGHSSTPIVRLAPGWRRVLFQPSGPNATRLECFCPQLEPLQGSWQSYEPLDVLPTAPPPSCERTELCYPITLINSGREAVTVSIVFWSGDGLWQGGPWNLGPGSRFPAANANESKDIYLIVLPTSQPAAKCSTQFGWKASGGALKGQLCPSGCLSFSKPKAVPRQEAHVQLRCS